MECLVNARVMNTMSEWRALNIMSVSTTEINISHEIILGIVVVGSCDHDEVLICLSLIQQTVNKIKFTAMYGLAV